MNRYRFEKYVAHISSINIHKDYAFKFSEDAFENNNKLLKITLESLPYLQYYSLGSVYRFGTILPVAKNPTVVEGDSVTFLLQAQENAYITEIFLEILDSPEIDKMITYNKAEVKFGTANELPDGMKSKKVSKKMNVPVYNHFLNKKVSMSVEFEYTVIERNE